MEISVTTDTLTTFQKKLMSLKGNGEIFVSVRNVSLDYSYYFQVSLYLTSLFGITTPLNVL